MNQRAYPPAEDPIDHARDAATEAGHAKHARGAPTLGPEAIDPDNFADLPSGLLELDRLLDACSYQDQTMTLGELDGFLAGILTLPRSLPERQWLPLIWGGGEQAISGDPVRSARLAELVRSRKERIAEALRRGGLAYAPVYGIDDRGETLWQPWLEGVVHAISLDGKDWDSRLRGGDEDVEAALLGLLRYMAVARGVVPDEMADDEIGLAPVMLPYFVETIYRRRRGLKRVVMSYEEPIRHERKIGRNEPCPCGSGRKYKKCCGAG